MQASTSGPQGAAEEAESELIKWYRKTCLGMGAGLAMSLVRRKLDTKEMEVFIPPRAQKLPPDVVDRWVRNVRLKHKVSVVSKETMVVAAVSGVYFGIEGLSKHWRGKDDALNTGLAGLLAGSMVGAMVPGPVQARTVVLVGLLGGVMGYSTAVLQSLLPRPEEL